MYLSVWLLTSDHLSLLDEYAGIWNLLIQRITTAKNHQTMVNMNELLKNINLIVTY